MAHELLNRVRQLKQKTSSLSRKRIRVRAKGRYPKGTPVSEVAMYQNDGTDRITPSHFVERAEAQANGWSDLVNEMFRLYLFDDPRGRLSQLKMVLKIAKDISAMCDRIKTGRLKASFVGEIVNE